MNNNLQFNILNINNQLDTFETELISETTTIMTENNYTKFYFDGNGYIFKKSNGEKHQLPVELDMIYIQYMDTLNRDDIVINL